MSTHYLMRCADCGNEGTMVKVDNPCPECGLEKDVFLCICGCKLEMCIDCLNTLTPPRVHHWRIVAETEGPEIVYPETAPKPNLGSDVLTLDEFAALYAAGRSMLTMIDTTPGSLGNSSSGERSSYNALKTALVKLDNVLNLEVRRQH